MLWGVVWNERGGDPDDCGNCCIDALALLWLTLHNERCAWKGFDWATTDRLHKKGMIGDPVNKSKSLILTDEGLECSEALFRKLFTRPPQ
ncbi:hypothetical protein SAMN05216228_10496 [Rhizobium tibeticum]|uniref:DUF6429 domain-containing protein n=2 Tax=Rhizobium tibeticum TaxID=501024 RepID=A0A1H8VXW2_9HYPH|nr:hypothetical protein RTCCBAU85039_6242 [Rhizobium tibeticum]SEP20185.1 hypothetical protein SAMN05216228_10496 [Rhizobium tibeticum]